MFKDGAPGRIRGVAGVAKRRQPFSKNPRGSRERVDLALAREIGVGVARPGGFEPPTS